MEYYATIKSNIEAYLIKYKDGQDIPFHYGIWDNYHLFNQNNIWTIIPVFLLKTFKYTHRKKNRNIDTNMLL